MKEGGVELVTYEELDEVRKRIVALLPPVAKADDGTQLALAYVTISYGLDPFMGDVWAIPKKVGGKFVGWGLMFGITARRKVAHRSGEYEACTFRWLTEEEARLLDVDLAKGCKGIACEVRRKGIKRPFVGFGVVFPDDKSKMNHGQLAKLRAERNALKMAFPVELPTMVTALPEAVIEIGDVEEREDGDVLAGGGDDTPAPDRGSRSRGAEQDVTDLFGEEGEDGA